MNRSSLTRHSRNRTGHESSSEEMVGEEKRKRDENVVSRAVIDACKPYSRLKTFPTKNQFSPEYRKAMMEKWHTLLARPGE